MQSALEEGQRQLQECLCHAECTQSSFRLQQSMRGKYLGNLLIMRE